MNKNFRFIYLGCFFLCSFSPQLYSVENNMKSQQNIDVLRNLSQRYISFINNIGSGKDSLGNEATSLFSENCKKNFNGQYIARDRATFVNDLLSVYKNHGSWSIIPITVITSDEDKSIVLRINIVAKNLGNNTAIVILRYNSRYLIEEIIEVFSPVQDGYDFNRVDNG